MKIRHILNYYTLTGSIKFNGQCLCTREPYNKNKNTDKYYTTDL